MESVFLKLVNMSLTASWMVLAVLILRLILKNGPKNLRVVLWGFVGLRLILPFSVQSAISMIPSTTPLRETFLYAPSPQISTGIPALNDAINPIITGTLAPAAGASANPTQIWSFIFSQIWILGLVLMLAYASVSYYLIHRRVAASIRIDQNLWLCDHIDSPFILGVFKPRIYLPSEMDPKTAELVLAHEYAHLKRKDHWWKPLGFALLCIYWFNPIIWLAYILLCRDIELACDEKVIAKLDSDDKKTYSSALLRCSINRKMIAACPLAFGEVGVKDRIKSVLTYKKPAFWIIVAAVVLCVIFAVCFLTDPAAKIDPLELENWGITVDTQDPTATDIMLRIDVPEHLDGEITVPMNQTQIKLTNGSWVEIPPVISSNTALTEFMADLFNGGVGHYRISWEHTLGALEPGAYQLRKTLWLHQDGVSHTKEFLVDFIIPEKGTHPEDEWTAQCRKALEQLQSMDTYHIHADRLAEGDLFLTGSAHCDFWNSGDTIMRISYLPEAGETIGFLRMDGIHYASASTDGSVNWISEANGAYGLIAASDSLEESLYPWVIRYRWNEETCDAISMISHSNGDYTIRLKINEPIEEPYFQASSYHADFRFDSRGKLIYIVEAAQSGTNIRTATYTLVEDTAAEIERYIAENTPSNQTSVQSGDYAFTLLESSHYSNAVSLKLLVTFPQDAELNETNAPYPKGTSLNYTTKSGFNGTTEYHYLTRSVDRQAKTITYQLVFCMEEGILNGKAFTLKIDGLEDYQGNTVAECPYTLSWQAEIIPARIYTYREADTHIHLTLSPVAISISASRSQFQSIDAVYDALVILDQTGAQIPVAGSYGGSQGGSLLNVVINPNVPLDPDSIGSISIGSYTLVPEE